MANRTMPSVYIRVILFSGKTKSPCFDLFIHWPIKQITNTYRKNFSRSYILKPRTIFFTFFASTQLKPLTEWIHFMKPRLFETILQSGLRQRPYESGWKNYWVSKTSGFLWTGPKELFHMYFLLFTWTYTHIMKEQ